MVEPLDPCPNEAAQRLAHRRGAHKLKLIGEGVEFLFFSAAIGTHYEGYRVPRARVYDTTNNPATPALGLQHKELELSVWALGTFAGYRAGIPESSALYCTVVAGDRQLQEGSTLSIVKSPIDAVRKYSDTTRVQGRFYIFKWRKYASGIMISSGSETVFSSNGIQFRVIAF
ncbi:hypothetical protein [Glutamicibacter sp. M10]|uniref:hypothetical protein n=1 Tax=Glutamicibacter sp. M10 TaxID=3023076 RepID=UPI0021C9CBE6|nr:hypothetical protein [Glutamicibacter sp. M10]UXN31699.1 hypothetical protein N6V40_15445 [Glutamicibacter sp. M10]